MTDDLIPNRWGETRWGPNPPPGGSLDTARKLAGFADPEPGPIEVSYVLAKEHERVELMHEALFAHVADLWRAHQARVEDLCRRVYEATAPEYRDRLHLIYEHRAPADQLPWVACTVAP